METVIEDTVIMTGVREYTKGYSIQLIRYNNRWVLKAGHDGEDSAVLVDLDDIIDWLVEHKPDMLEIL